MAKIDPNEALNHLTYFKAQRHALNFAIGRLQDDLKIVEKNVKLWERRTGKTEGEHEGNN
jgi:hypothetical protein